jgi:hypothetical protein
MKTGLEMIKDIASISSQIADLTRFITSHPTANKTVDAEEMRVQLEIQRDELRKDLEKCPDLSFT